MARTRNTKPRPKRTLLSHFRDKKLVAPKPTPRSTPAPTITVEVNPTLSDLKGDQRLQNQTGGTLNTIKLIGMNSRFAKICKKSQEQKWLKN